VKRLNLEHVESWLALVENGSFRAAAKRLSLSQPTVTQHIQRLEAYIGGKLIERSKRGCVPTALGRRWSPIARSLLNADKQVSQILSPSPRLGACSNIGMYLLPQLLASFCERQPRPTLRFGTNPEIIELLEAGQVEIGLVEWWEARPGLIAIPWRREPMVVITPPGHAWADQPYVTLSDLQNTPMIGGEPGTGTGRLLREILANGVSLAAPSMELGSTEAVKRTVAAGLGISIVLASSCVSEIRDGRLLACRLEPEVYKTLWLVRLADIDSANPLFSYLSHSQPGTISLQ
jgi:DNA-binding transcriptional LysR family regulator